MSSSSFTPGTTSNGERWNASHYPATYSSVLAGTRQKLQRVPPRIWLLVCAALGLMLLAFFSAKSPYRTLVLTVPTSFHSTPRKPCTSDLVLLASLPVLQQVMHKKETWGKQPFPWRQCKNSHDAASTCTRDRYMVDALPTTEQPYMKRTKLREILYNWYIGPLESMVTWMGPVIPEACQRLLVLGLKGGDEERYVCGYREMATTSREEKCVIFSVGSNNQFEFEESVRAGFPSSCAIHTFDCTVAVPTPPKDVPLTFHKVCLGARKETIDGRAFASLQDMIDMTGGSQPTVLKMDIEGWEWTALVQIMESAEKAWRETKTNIYPQQIALEIHTNMAPWSVGYMYEEETLAYFNYLYYRHGYVLVYERPNVVCPSCWEILLVRVACDA